VIAVFFVVAVVGSFCNLLTVIYIGNEALQHGARHDLASPCL